MQKKKIIIIIIYCTGNTALEEIAMAIYTHPNTFPVYHHIETTQIFFTSQLVQQRTGMSIQANKAIVGANAFAHESGIHQDGVLKCKETYEIIRPDVVGVPAKALVLGKHSGRNAFRTRMESMLGDSVYANYFNGHPTEFEALFERFKKLADSKKSGVTDQDLYALLDDQLASSGSGQNELWRLASLQVVTGTNMLSTSTIGIYDLRQPPIVSQSPDTNTSLEPVPPGLLKLDAAIGRGPVQAIFKAIARIIGTSGILTMYKVNAVTEGSDSLGKVTVQVTPRSDKDLDNEMNENDIILLPTSEVNENEMSTTGRRVYSGIGTESDILVASAKAYINALNRMVLGEQRRKDAEALLIKKGIDQREVNRNVNV